MCNYADAIEMKGIRRGLKRGLKQGRKEGKEEGIKEGRAEGLRALVCSLEEFIKDFEDLVKAVRKNKAYEDVSAEEIGKYFSLR